MKELSLLLTARTGPESKKRWSRDPRSDRRQRCSVPLPSNDPPCAAHTSPKSPVRIRSVGTPNVVAQARRAQAVIVDEEESLVLEDRTANGDAVIVAVKRRKGLSETIGEPVIRIEDRIAHEVVRAAMKLVGPERVIMLTTDAPENPYSALKLVCCTLNSSIASGDGR